ncbi:porin [Methylobacterium isbiliense]|uniref:porin n=1 Tax=Methylobacterium isbiliense TaxID=315478 RepID=UPI0025B5366D|nr:porin [Methylobacterium isbiliense]MDN3627862.1 porin [Methylobacterium isbiliense]
MKLVKSLLLGSAAGLTLVSGAQAADMPIKKAVPVEYVRICTAYGAGFFYIPGTDTCLRVGGRARFEAGYVQSFSRNAPNGDLTQYRGLGRLNLDARTQTAYGTLRAFVRFDIASATGNYLASGTQQRISRAYPALGVDTFGRSQQYVNVDKAFVQFAGLTAGRASSFFDFYAHDFEIIATSLGSDVFSTNLIAYTAQLGNGFSATVSLEDPIFRKTPLFGNAATNANLASQFNIFTGNFNVSPVLSTTVDGAPGGLAFLDVVQRSRMPDFVGALRYDAAWGSAQISAAVHEINTGNATNLLISGTNAGLTGAALTAAVLPAGTLRVAPRAQNEYGWAVQGGLKVNLPFIAAGDALYLQGAYGEGATLYTGYSTFSGSYSSSGAAAAVQGASLNQFFSDAVVDPITGRLDLSTSWTVVGSFLHYWTPQWRSAVFGSYGEIAFGRTSRANLAALNFNGLSSNPAINAFSQTLRDNNQIVAGASLIWSPVKDLDIGVEGSYARVSLRNGRAVDLNKNPGQTVAAVVNGIPVNSAGAPLATSKATDVFHVRMRVQRDF